MRKLGDGSAPPRSRSERLSSALRRLDDERDCWFVSSDPEHGPYVVPLSFAVSGDEAILATGARRRSVRNVRREPRVVLVLGGHGDPLWLEGSCNVVGADELEPELRSAYVAKAGWQPGPEFVYLRVALERVLSSRSPVEDRDRAVWTRPARHGDEPK